MQRNIVLAIILIGGLAIHSYFTTKPVLPPVGPPPSEQSHQTLHTVVSVIDGDTAIVSIDGVNEKIRFIGIDTPEVDPSRGAIECYGKDASDKTKALLLNQTVRIETDLTQGERDTYGRLLAYVFLADGTNVNQLLLQEGFAKEFTYNKAYMYQSEFKQAEADARTQKRGLWSEINCP